MTNWVSPQSPTRERLAKPAKPISGGEKPVWRRWWMIPLCVLGGVLILLGFHLAEDGGDKAAEVKPSTFVSYNRPDDGFRIALPEAWTVIDGSESSGTLQSLGLSREAVQETRELEATGNYPIQAVGSGGDFMIQVQASPVPLVPVGLESFELAMQFFASQIAGDSGDVEVVATEAVSVDGVEGFHGSINIAKGGLSGRMHAHYFNLGGLQYGVYMVGDGDAEYVDELFDAIISTLEFTHDEV